MSIVHITCGLCGSDFQVTKKAVDSLPPYGPAGGQFDITYDCKDGSVTAVKMEILNNKIDLCPKCSLGFVAMAIKGFRGRLSRLMTTPMQGHREEL